MVNSLSFTERKRVRKNFGTLKEVTKFPNLIEIQKDSYASFLLEDHKPSERPDKGLQKVFKSVFPLEDFSGSAHVEFIEYDFDQPKFDVDECRQRDKSYAAPLKIKLRLIVFDIDEETESRTVKDIKEQEIYLCDLPLMTDRGTFITNGTERVIVSQMHRSPGVFFDHDKGKTHSSGKLLFGARVIPYRGSWLDIEFDHKDILFARIDRKKKIHITTFLMAMGIDRDDILSMFYEIISVKKSTKSNNWEIPFEPKNIKVSKLQEDLVDASTGKVVIKQGTKINPAIANKLAKDGLKNILLESDNLIGKFLAEDIINSKSGEVYFEASDEITPETLEKIDELGLKNIHILNVDGINVGAFIRDTLRLDKNLSPEDAVVEIYKVLRPGEPPNIEAAFEVFNSLFFKVDKYDLSDVGRVKMNFRLNLDCPDDVTVLRSDDVIAVIKTVIDLRTGKGEIDDIDHLGNRRVRSVGELTENVFRMGLIRMERSIKERMNSLEVDAVTPQDIINAKPLVASLKEFFGTSQLSQFMDQTNPLAEITHKRRLSALGPGGLSRERAGFEVRDVHPTHYGRICPIETPEGPNIGLINSLASHAKVNKYGFIESPYRKVIDGKVSNQIDYLSAMEETQFTIAQANTEIDDKGNFLTKLISSRRNGDFVMTDPNEIDYMDVSPKQVVSCAASLIPFLENDDANRALMGSNMMRQAVPLIQAESPLVGTGVEQNVAIDSGVTIIARREGVVDRIDGKRIVVRVTENISTEESGVDIYTLQKFQRSNQSTCINQRPLVKVGDKVKTGDIIADGQSTHLGELGLGRNVVVAFMPWRGYNFEDSILISEKIVQEDKFTSIHIDDFEVMSRDTKLGAEEITRDIPNVGDEMLSNLDEAGIVYVGAEVHPGDILVGKVTPKGESPVTPEEKLLRAIFGEKATDVKDTSLRLPPGSSGTVVDVKVFNRYGIEKDDRALAIERDEIEKLANDREAELGILNRNIKERLLTLIGDKNISNSESGEIKLDDIWKMQLPSKTSKEQVDNLKKQYDAARTAIQKIFDNKVNKVQRGDELLPGVMKMVKVFVAVKRKLQPGDKMAGRHGNKGVISKINPVEDMPYLADGRTVDIVLNPLGVPSRMNVGQILETHLGWACAGIGDMINNSLKQYKQNSDINLIDDGLKIVYGEKQFSEDISPLNKNEKIELAGNLTSGVPIKTPVFDGASESEISIMLKEAGFNESGQSDLWDGISGEKFERQVTVGIIYMLKLHHLVDDKIHARSIGPYSLVTQQPLGGKAQFGGQRFGEMEVWALEAYGAAYTLQEILTVKSDDVAGRTKVYETIIRGEDVFQSGTPESFNVLIKEIRALGLNIELSNNTN
ncbi:DNA-directed RNA polymerase subunit beta [Pelagibacteraceae bacterium]|nr:DNA-directed RNA polymerase subunit beta [Pelagibacteraceae bacterium]